MSNFVKGSRCSCSLSQLFVFAVLVLLAALLRFYGLGTWSFDRDEIATKIECRYFFEHQPLPDSIKGHPCYHPEEEKSQFCRLPRLVCAASFVHWIDCRIFGEDEFGSRFLMAVMGSLSVGIAFLLGRSLFGFSGSLILALLILLSPEHVYNSQNARFYCQAFLMIEIVLLLGGHVAVNRSLFAAICLGPAAIIMVLSHSLTVLIWGILFLGLLIDFFLTREPDRESKNQFATKIPRKLVLILCAWSIVIFLIVLVHIMPLSQSWNQFETRISPLDSVLTFAFIFGRPYLILCFPAWVWALLSFRNAGQTYWLFVSLACGTVILLLPLKIIFYQWYGILFAFPLFVILAMFINHIGQLLTCSHQQYGRYCALVWCCFALLLNIAALRNYYKGGDRYDYRSACRYIEQHWQPGDRLICHDGTEIIHQYLPQHDVPTSLWAKQSKEWLLSLFDPNKPEKDDPSCGRYWLILKREIYFAFSEEVREWIDRHGQRQSHFGASRYEEPRVLDVFLCSPQPFGLTPARPANP
ncbi:MAG: glycosyltransferase family 39 protein [Planctomycetaceae bacterium]|jgi:hypothetical protein|nr:glycosyltransferase family 39 protein [Planctomycetaceae bacterium]